MKLCFYLGISSAVKLCLGPVTIALFPEEVVDNINFIYVFDFLPRPESIRTSIWLLTDKALTIWSPTSLGHVATAPMFFSDCLMVVFTGNGNVLKRVSAACAILQIVERTIRV